MSTTSRSSRVTALAIAIAIGTSGTIAITPVSGAQTTTTTTQQQQLENIREINVSDYAATPGDRENGGGKDSSIQTFASPGEQLKVTSSIPSEHIDNIELLYMGQEVSAYENTPDDIYKEFSKWFYDHIQFDEDTGVVTIKIPEDKWESTQTQDGLILTGERSRVHNDDTSGYVQLGYNFSNAGDGNDLTNLPTENFIVSTMDPAGYDLFQDTTNKDLVATQGQRTVIPNALHEPGTVYSPEWVTHEKYEEQDNQATNNGDLVLSPGYGVEPGTHDLVIDTKSDGSSESDDDFSTRTIIIPDYITVNPSELNEDFSPTYPATEVESGGSATATINYGQSSPGDSQSPTYGIPESFKAPEGWTVTVNKDTGVLNVTAPETTESTTVEVPVTVSYPDGTTDTVTAGITLTVITADITEPSWEDATINPGQRLTIPSVGDDIPEDADIRVTGLPRGWTTGIGQNNDILVTAPDSAEDKSTQTMTITVTYADGSTDVVEVEIAVSNPSLADVNDLSYEGNRVVAQYDTATLTPSFGDGNPEVESYSLDSAANWVSLDQDTGVITASPDERIQPGTEANATVTVFYSDGSQDTTDITLTVGDPAISVTTDITYPESSVRIDETVDIAPVFAPDTPDTPVSFSAEGTIPSWMTVNPDTGVITVSPNDTVQVRDYAINIVATYSDGSQDKTTTTITVNDVVLSKRIEVGYSQGRLAPRGDVTTISPTVVPEIPEGTVFSLPNNQDLFTIDPETGALTITPTLTVPIVNGPANAVVGVTYSDGSEATIPVSFNVSAMSTGDNPVTYESHSVSQGGTGVFTPRTEDGDYSYRPGDDFPDWASVDADTGTVTVTPGYRVPSGEVSFNVDFTYPDGSTGVTTIEMDIISVEQSTWLTPNYAPISVVAGQVVDSDRPNFGTNGQPVGNVRYEIEDSDWARVDSNGVITVEAPLELEGQSQTLTVNITYSDGSTDVTDVEVVIGERNDNDVYDPFYSTTTVAQNKSDTISIAYQGDAPDNASYSKGAGFPEWAELNDDGTITINPTFAGTTLGSHQINVQVRYDDGTTESVTAGVTVTRGADNDNYSLSYLGGTVKQGESITLDPVITDHNRASASPDDAAYRILSGPEWISVDANTGVVTARPSIDVPMSSYEFEVEVIYQDGTRDTTRSGVNISGTTDATRYQLTYGGGTRVEQGDTVTGVSPVRTIGEPMPDGTTLTAIDAPSWVTVNEDGSYTVAPGYRVGAGNYPVTVMVSYPDRSSENVILPIIVTRAEIAKEFDSPTYQSMSVTQGQSVSSSAPTQGTRTLPTGTSYRLQYGAPNWVSLDPSTGVITLEPGFKVSPGIKTIPVDIVYPDGSGLTTELELKVEPGKFSDGYNPSYSSGLDVPQGSQVTIPAPRDSDGQRLPVGTKYDTHKDNPTWISVGVDGTVTASPGYKVEPGAYQGITVVTYEDGTVDQVPIAIRVLPEDDPAEAPVTSTPQGFTDYSEEYIPSWQRSEGGTSVSVSDIPEGYSVNDQGEVVDSQGRPVDGASVSDDGRVTVPGQTTTTSGPSVNTGGHVSSSGLWNWLVSLFR